MNDDKETTEEQHPQEPPPSLPEDAQTKPEEPVFPEVKFLLETFNSEYPPKPESSEPRAPENP
jgi:hypothetical protein